MGDDESGEAVREAYQSDQFETNCITVVPTSAASVLSFRHRSTSLRTHRSPETACRKASGQVGTHHSINIKHPSVDRTLGSSLKPDACLRPVLSRTRAAVAHAATLPFALASRSSS